MNDSRDDAADVVADVPGTTMNRLSPPSAVVIPAQVLPPPVMAASPAAADASETVPDISRIDAILDRIMSVQRPAVLAHLRGVRSRNPDASPEQILRILERRYLATVTTSGAGVGVAGAVPAVGTAAALALSSADTVLFLETTALYAQSVAELHGIPVEDPERGRALVLAMVIGGPSKELLGQFAGRVSGRGPAQQEFWGAMIAKNMPRTAVVQFMDYVRRVYLPRMVARTAGTIVGRVLPFGIGAVVGGAASQILGRRVIKTARVAFGPPPPWFPESTRPKVIVREVRAAKKADRADAAEQRRAIRAAKREGPHG